MTKLGVRSWLVNLMDRCERGIHIHVLMYTSARWQLSVFPKMTNYFYELSLQQQTSSSVGLNLSPHVWLNSACVLESISTLSRSIFQFLCFSSSVPSPVLWMKIGRLVVLSILYLSEHDIYWDTDEIVLNKPLWRLANSHLNLDNWQVR